MIEKKSLRIFGLLWGLILAFFSYKNNSQLLISLSIFFFISSIIYPELFLKSYIYPGWIKLGNFIGGINSKIIIFILFFLIFTPMGIILKAIGKDFLKEYRQNKNFLSRG